MIQGDESKEKEKGELRKQGLGRTGGHRVHYGCDGLGSRQEEDIPGIEAKLGD